MDNTESEDGDELQGEEPEDDQPRVRIDDVVKALPLVNDDLYIGMQAMNLEIVDSMIESMEEDLLAEYIEKERTPIPSVMMVSALSQLWIFGVYELLRTWRQRVQSVLSFGDKASTMEPADRALACDAKEASFQRPEVDAAGVAPHVGAFRQAANSAEYREVLRTALYRSEIPFRRIESLRLHLAKHEVPKKHGLYGAGAGYSRINYDGSIQFHVPLGGNQMDLITRRQIGPEGRVERRAGAQGRAPGQARRPRRAAAPAAPGHGRPVSREGGQAGGGTRTPRHPHRSCRGHPRPH